MFYYNVSRLREYAKDLLEVALNHDALDWYVIGISSYSIETEDQHGGKKENTFIKMQAIYEKHKENPDIHLDERFYSLLVELLPKVTGFWGFMNILEYIGYQIVGEAEGNAPFKMDIHHLLDLVNDNLVTNMAIYQSPACQEVGFLANAKQRCDSFRKYGYFVEAI